MSNAQGRIFCQRCRAANSLEQELCLRCGTRLMLVVEPPVLRFEEETALQRGDYEEHLLERVTALEQRLLRIAERLGQTLELLLKQARQTSADRALLDTLVGVLAETGVVSASKLEARWRERNAQESAEEEERERRERVRASAVAGFGGSGREAFARLVGEGFAALGRGEDAKGVRVLERAAALAPASAPLNAFLGEHFFRAGKTALARSYLARAFDADPEDGRVRLLLGLACGDEGEAERARELLSEAVRRDGDSFAAHFALGRLAAAEDDWKAALAEFKRALAAHACPEAHYVLGLACYQLGRDRTALRHLTKAVEGRTAYAEAFYLLGLVRLRLGERQKALEAFRAAQAADGREPRYRLARKRLSSRSGSVPPPPPLVEAVGRGRRRRRLVTGGDPRLAEALRTDALRRAAPR